MATLEGNSVKITSKGCARGDMERTYTIEGNELIMVNIHSIGRGSNVAAGTREDLAALRALPGVRAAEVVNSIPFGHGAQISGVSLTPDQPAPTIEAATYTGDVGLPDALGLRLVEGRRLLPDEILEQKTFEESDDPHLPSTLVTRAAAVPRAETARLFAQLERLRLSAPALVVNAVTRAPACAWCRATGRYGR